MVAGGGGGEGEGEGGGGGGGEGLSESANKRNIHEKILHKFLKSCEK